MTLIIEIQVEFQLYEVSNLQNPRIAKRRASIHWYWIKPNPHSWALSNMPGSISEQFACLCLWTQAIQGSAHAGGCVVLSPDWQALLGHCWTYKISHGREGLCKQIISGLNKKINKTISKIFCMWNVKMDKDYLCRLLLGCDWPRPLTCTTKQMWLVFAFCWWALPASLCLNVWAGLKEHIMYFQISQYHSHNVESCYIVVWLVHALLAEVLLTMVISQATVMSCSVSFLED